jgi:hypothetical protein
MDVFNAQLATQKYMVVFPDMTAKLYCSLRDVARDLSASHSTLSRKLRSSSSFHYFQPSTGYAFLVSAYQPPPE